MGRRVFGAAHPHHAYLFANRRANRMKVLVHEVIGVWLAARRFDPGRFVWPAEGSTKVPLTRAQLDALVLDSTLALRDDVRFSQAARR